MFTCNCNIQWNCQSFAKALNAKYLPHRWKSCWITLIILSKKNMSFISFVWLVSESWLAIIFNKFASNISFCRITVTQTSNSISNHFMVHPQYSFFVWINYLDFDSQQFAAQNHRNILCVKFRKLFKFVFLNEITTTHTIITLILLLLKCLYRVSVFSDIKWENYSQEFIKSF